MKLTQVWSVKIHDCFSHKGTNTVTQMTSVKEKGLGWLGSSVMVPTSMQVGEWVESEVDEEYVVLEAVSFSFLGRKIQIQSG